MPEACMDLLTHIAVCGAAEALVRIGLKGKNCPQILAAWERLPAEVRHALTHQRRCVMHYALDKTSLLELSDHKCSVPPVGCARQRWGNTWL